MTDNQTFGEFFAQLDAKKARDEEKALQEKAQLTIYTDGRHPDPIQLLHRAIRTGSMAGAWTDAALIPKMEAEARKKAKREAEEIVPTPEPEFDREEV